MFKIILILLAVLSMGFSQVTFSACDAANTNQSVTDFLSECAKDSQGKAVITDKTDRAGVKDLVKTIAERVIIFGALFAIGAIVFAGIRYTTSAGDDEKIKSAKNTLIYAVVGFTLLLVAFPLVDVIIGFIYGIGG